MRNFLLGIVIGWITLSGVYQFHLVRNDDGFMIVPKNEASVAESYADIRDWGPLDWTEHPILVQSMIEQGHKDLISTTPELPDLSNFTEMSMPEDWAWWKKWTN